MAAIAANRGIEINRAFQELRERLVRRRPIQFARLRLQNPRMEREAVIDLLVERIHHVNDNRGVTHRLYNFIVRIFRSEERR